jgi:hypothetical protein
MARILTPQDDEQVVTVTEAELRLDDPDPDTRYTVRLLPEAKMREIDRRHTKRRPNARGEMVEATDHEGVGRETVDWVIKDWAGIVARTTAGDLVPVPCLTEAKVGLDPRVRAALIDYASRNQRIEAKALEDSFRRPA